jgi:hypothetical protein
MPCGALSTLSYCLTENQLPTEATAGAARLAHGRACTHQLPSPISWRLSPSL